MKIDLKSSLVRSFSFGLLLVPFLSLPVYGQNMQYKGLRAESLSKMRNRAQPETNADPAEFIRQLKIKKSPEPKNDQFSQKPTQKQLIDMTKMTRGGVDAGGGGNPILQKAENYPTFSPQTKALEAAAIVVERIGHSKLPSELKSAILEELKELIENNRFKLVPEVIIWDSMGGNHFLSFGAYTGFELGSIVLISKTFKSDDLQTFAELLAHEVLHHVLTPALSVDESFVDQLVQSIFSGEMNDQMVRVLLKGFDLQPDKILAPQFVEAIRPDLESAFGEWSTPEWMAFKGKLIKKLEEKMTAEFGLDLTSQKVVRVVFYMNNFINENLKYNGRIQNRTKILNDILETLRQKINPSGKFSPRMTHDFGHKESRFFPRCGNGFCDADEELVSFKELYFD